MVSQPVKYLAGEPRNYNVEEMQHTSDGLAAPIPYSHGENDRQSKIDTNVSFSHNEQTSPIPNFHLLPPPASARGPPLSPFGPFADIRRFCALQWQKHKGPIFVFSAQLFGALMNLFARLLELGDVDARLHPMQLLFWRMLLTTLACSLYIVWQKIPHGLLGNPEVRWLLVVRGFSGFFGIYGVWYSIQYLPLAEATVITFLAPNLAGYLCHIFLKDPYTRTEQLASLLALGGVVLITKPTSLFSGTGQVETAVQTAVEVIANVTMMAIPQSNITGPAMVDPNIPTTSERLGAIGVALLGVVGTAFAFTTLRAIGPRTHTLISVNYFSSWCVTVAFSVLIFAPYLNIGQPDLQFAFPSSIRQWGFLLLTTACGLAVQVLITKGLAAERSNRATAMTYTHMIFAAGFDRLVWGTTMGWMSATGCAMIIAGAIWVAVGKEGATKGTGSQNEGNVGIEGVPMLGTELEDQDDDGIIWEPRVR
ncbi:hypothetical protein GGR58DRAFT_515024 [Xylaria digitata]|nr:hypothetical protein GGR58DRAFT_515024 [Xylaria digitata]